MDKERQQTIFQIFFSLCYYYICICVFSISVVLYWFEERHSLLYNWFILPEFLCQLYYTFKKPALPLQKYYEAYFYDCLRKLQSNPLIYFSIQLFCFKCEYEPYTNKSKIKLLSSITFSNLPFKTSAFV